MKKSLLSILAVVAMAFVAVSCGNGKIVEAQVAKLNALTLKFDSVQTQEQFSAIGVDFEAAANEWVKVSADKTMKPEEIAKIDEATAAFMAKSTEVGTRLRAEAEAKAAEEAAAAELAKAEEEAAAKTAKKK